jgi:hypothetical protein
MLRARIPFGFGTGLAHDLSCDIFHDFFPL